MIIKNTESETENQKMSQENYVRGNNVYILGLFDKSISAKVIPDLNDLIETASFAKQPEINFYINSYGGYSSELLGLLSLIDIARSKGIKINTYNLGVAYSCGSLLAIYGDKRYMYRYATNLAHLGSAGFQSSTFEQLDRSTKHINEWFNMIIDIYTSKVKMSKKDLMKLLKDDNGYLNAAECLKYGFCDEVI